MEDFRKFFQKKAPFAVSGSELKLENVKPAYQILDSFHHGSVDSYPSVTSIIAESKQLQEAQELFELFQSDYIMLQRCNEELLFLKSVWDMGEWEWQGCVSTCVCVRGGGGRAPERHRHCLSACTCMISLPPHQNKILHHHTHHLPPPLPHAAGAVMYMFNDWYKTPWDKIDVEFLVEETKKLAKDIKTLNKAVRNYEVCVCV